jgi:hypothetical protein
MYRGDRRRKEDLRKAKQDAKRARRAERKESGHSGPEIEDRPPAEGPTEFVWFSPAKGRTLSTPTSTPPSIEGIDDWTLVSEPPRPNGPAPDR